MAQAPFPVWSLLWQDVEPCDEPHMDDAQRIVAVSVHHGQPFAEGPGAIVTSYSPQPAFVDGRVRPEGDHFEVLMRGPLALGRAMTWQFKRMPPQRENARGIDRLEPLLRYPTHDAFIQCGNVLVPALKFCFGIPEATVIVSADLLTHPIALGFWQWPVRVPVLDRVSFE